MKKLDQKVRFLGHECTAYLSNYQEGNGIAIELTFNDPEMDGMEVPMAVATVNIPMFPPAENEVYIKDYSENEGMLEALEEAGIVKRTGRSVSTGFVSIPICKLLV